MFERIKAYKRIKKSNKFLKGCKLTAELTGDEEMLKEANETLYLNDAFDPHKVHVFDVETEQTILN